MPHSLINQTSTYYIQKGEGYPVVCLVGWAQDTRMFEPTADHLSNRFKVTVVDYPGFGNSEPMKEPWDVDAYVEWLHALCLELKIEKPILIAHSFGARLAIKYAVKYGALKMVLTGAAGLIPKRTFSYHLRVNTYKALKKISTVPGLKELSVPFMKSFGSQDYKALDGTLRQSFVKIVNEDLSESLPKIQCPTLLVWGTLDDATPLWMGQKMEQLIPDAGLVLFENDDHYAYWHQIDRFHTIVDAFVKEDNHGHHH